MASIPSSFGNSLNLPRTEASKPKQRQYASIEEEVLHKVLFMAPGTEITAYSLLGIAPFEDDLDVILDAAEMRMKKLKEVQTSARYQGAVQTLLNKIAQALVILRSAPKKAEYDANLRKKEEKTPKVVQQQTRKAAENVGLPVAKELPSKPAPPAAPVEAPLRINTNTPTPRPKGGSPVKALIAGGTIAMASVLAYFGSKGGTNDQPVAQVTPDDTPKKPAPVKTVETPVRPTVTDPKPTISDVTTPEKNPSNTAVSLPLADPRTLPKEPITPEPQETIVVQPEQPTEPVEPVTVEPAKTVITEQMLRQAYQAQIGNLKTSGLDGAFDAFLKAVTDDMEKVTAKEDRRIILDFVLTILREEFEASADNKSRVSTLLRKWAVVTTLVATEGNIESAESLLGEMERNINDHEGLLGPDYTSQFRKLHVATTAKVKAEELLLAPEWAEPANVSDLLRQLSELEKFHKSRDPLDQGIAAGLKPTMTQRAKEWLAKAPSVIDQRRIESGAVKGGIGKGELESTNPVTEGDILNLQKGKWNPLLNESTVNNSAHAGKWSAENNKLSLIHKGPGVENVCYLFFPDTKKMEAIESYELSFELEELGEGTVVFLPVGKGKVLLFLHREICGLDRVDGKRFNENPTMIKTETINLKPGSIIDSKVNQKTGEIMITVDNRTIVHIKRPPNAYDLNSEWDTNNQGIGLGGAGSGRSVFTNIRLRKL